MILCTPTQNTLIRVLVKAPPVSVYGKYSTKGYVEKQIQHEAKLSAVLVSRHLPSAVFFVHTSLYRRCFNCYVAFLVLSDPIQLSQSSK